jgi:hypothetical protein
MRTKEITTEPQITESTEPQDFGKPVTIRWDPMGTPNVKGWWLCVGTLETDEGDWNIFSDHCYLATETPIDVSKTYPNLKGIRVQLLCTVKDDELDMGERTMVLEPIVIKNIYDTYKM